MTVVITYLATDNAKNRKHKKTGEFFAKKDADRELARRIEKAWAKLTRNTEYQQQILAAAEGYTEYCQNPAYKKVTNEAGRQIHAVQKRKGSSIPLI